MHRKALDNLKTWLNSDTRKPLILRGARQVGKTWLVRALSEQTGKQLVELNLENQRQLAVHFESNDPAAILLNLESALNVSINPDNTILFLDEIQATPELLAKLRWFYETLPELPVMAAGSLLEFALEKYEFSMPVGRISYMFIEPLDFEEFLLAKGEMHLLAGIENLTLESPFNEALHQKANHLFKEYLTVGGMPEAVSSWVRTNSLESLAETHHDLINTYKDDFSKYAGKLSIDYLEDVLNATPTLMTKKVKYNQISPTARHASIKQAVRLLSKAKLCHIVQCTNANGIPLGAETNPKTFKMILIDVGLASTLLDLRLYQFRTIDEIMLINKGALAEQVAGQLLRLLAPFYVEPKLYYWNREAQSASAEIDYLIQNNHQLVPVEVKAGSEGKLRSLHQFFYEKPQWKKAIRIYAGNANETRIKTKTTSGHPVEYGLISLPFYLIGQIYRLLNGAPETI
ncbi:MAG: AAA family ATPase [Legionellaceae bacterium]|nr:AAA family ATPase [Legionellaceae bacterium]|tara:strand:- start:1094 stop:2473 length:1380 start_codon:yes stop_codon:yes gene_type:complete